MVPSPILTLTLTYSLYLYSGFLLIDIPVVGIAGVGIVVCSSLLSAFSYIFKMCVSYIHV